MDVLSLRHVPMLLLVVNCLAAVGIKDLRMAISNAIRS